MRDSSTSQKWTESRYSENANKHNAYRKDLACFKIGDLKMSHRDDDPDKTKEEYDQDNHSDQENPNNEEYDKDGAMLFRKRK